MALPAVRECWLHDELCSFLGSLLIVAHVVTSDITLAQTVFTTTFVAGLSTLTLPVPIVNDLIHEGAEDFSVQFSVVGSQSVEADSTRQTATVTITDNEDSKEGVLKMDSIVDISSLSCPQFPLSALLRVPSRFPRRMQVLVWAWPFLEQAPVK